MSPFEGYFEQEQTERPRTPEEGHTGYNHGSQQQTQNFNYSSQRPQTSPFSAMDTINLITNPMSEQGLGHAKDYAAAYATSWMSKYFHQLRYYFDVTHAFVLSKLKLIIAPFLEQDEWRDQYDSSNAPASPRFNKHSIDLFIPTMAFITFLLLSALALGTRGNFSPEIIGFQCSTGLVLIFLESLIMLSGFYLLGTTGIPTTDIAAIAGYKYVSINLNIAVALLFGGDIFYPACAYTCTMIAIFTVKSLKRYTHHRTLADSVGTVSNNKTSFIYIIGILQFPIVFYLSNQI